MDKLVLCCMLITTVSEHPSLLFSKVTDISGCSTKLVKNHRFSCLTTGSDRQEQMHFKITSGMQSFVMWFYFLCKRIIFFLITWPQLKLNSSVELFAQYVSWIVQHRGRIKCFISGNTFRNKKKDTKVLWDLQFASSIL